MKRYFAIDIGGTAIKYGVISQNGELIFSAKTETESNNGIDCIIKKLEDIINQLKKTYKDVECIGISSAGIIDNKRGKVIYAGYTMPGYTGTKLKSILEERTGMHVKVENDVNCAILGEKWLGAGKDLKNFMMITVGTGIGGAIFVDNKLYTGSGFAAGEIGYMKIDGEDFQLKASTSTLIRNVNKLIKEKELTGEEVFELAKTNNLVKKEVEKFYNYLAEGLNNVACLLNPEKIVIGGGVTENIDFEKNINKAFEIYIDGMRIKKDLIKTAELGNKAGMFGAVYEFISEQ